MNVRPSSPLEIIVFASEVQEVQGFPSRCETGCFCFLFICSKLEYKAEETLCALGFGEQRG